MTFPRSPAARLPRATAARVARALCAAALALVVNAAAAQAADMARKSEMNRAWDEWVDTKNPPMRACIGADLEAPHIVEIVVTAAK